MEALAMLTAPVCPDFTQYKKLATGQLASPDKEALLDHLEACPACVQRVEALSDKDTLVDLIRQARTLGDCPVGETVACLIERLRELRPNAEAGGKAPAQIRLACSGCGKSLKVKANLAGKKPKCPHCQAVIPVPNAVQPDKSPQPPPSAEPEALTVAPASSGGGKNAVQTASGAGACPSQHASTDQHLYNFLAPPQAADELGRLGSYRVLRVLGAGGMGVVFQAEDPHLQRLVALKAMLPNLADSESAKQRFLREARAAAALKHDHIVTIHQVGEDRGAPFLAMEFLEGEPLDDRLKREGKLPLADVLRIGREMADGLAAAHERGLIHRDIKPANVWLEGKKGRVKILDFGLARAANDEAHLTQSGAFVGTPAYMAPEQAQGKNIDPRSDLFSLGCVLYRMATGKIPFRGAYIHSTLMAVATENPAPPVSLNFELPTELSDLIMQLLAKNPEDRPESAQAVAETLGRMALDRQPPKAAKTGARQKEPKVAKPGARPVRSRRGRRIAVAVVGLALLVPLGYWLSGIIVRVESKEGTLVIKTEDPSVSVKVTPEGGATLTYGKDQREIHLKPGKYGIELADAKDGLKLSTTQLTITSGDNKIVEVFWEKKNLTQGKTAVTDAWLKEVAALPVDKQADAVAAKLKDLNPGFDGKVDRSIENGAVVELQFPPTDAVVDLSPVRALPGLRRLNLSTPAGKGKLADLTPLEGMKLSSLQLFGCGQVGDLRPLKGMPLTTLGLGGFGGCVEVRDLAPLQGMKLTMLHLSSCDQVRDLTPLKDMPLTFLDLTLCRQVHDLTPLQGMPLKTLGLYGCFKVRDLTPLQGMKLTSLNLAGCAVQDLTPLQGMPLTSLALMDCDQVRDLTPLEGMPLELIQFNPKNIVKGIEGIRRMESMKTIVTNDRDPKQFFPAQEFWKKYDAGEFSK